MWLCLPEMQSSFDNTHSKGPSNHFWVFRAADANVMYATNIQKGLNEQFRLFSFLIFQFLDNLIVLYVSYIFI